MSTAPGSLTFVFRFQDYFNLSATRSPFNRKLSGSEPLTPQAVVLADVFTSEVLQPKRQLINHGAEGTGSPLCVAVSGKRSDFFRQAHPDWNARNWDICETGAQADAGISPGAAPRPALLRSPCAAVRDGFLDAQPFARSFAFDSWVSQRTKEMHPGGAMSHSCALRVVCVS